MSRVSLYPLEVDLDSAMSYEVADVADKGLVGTWSPLSRQHVHGPLTISVDGDGLWAAFDRVKDGFCNGRQLSCVV